MEIVESSSFAVLLPISQRELAGGRTATKPVTRPQPRQQRAVSYKGKRFSTEGALVAGLQVVLRP
jgi:hypothetical protein